jgi:putative exosortase-associated protein (TIGR04073 family)
MPKITFTIVPLLGLALILAGCAGPEEKLGRGLMNMGEIVRMGEMRRSIEQTAVIDDSSLEFTTGVLRGADRTAQREFAGFYEVFTFPFPNHSPKDYGPIFFPAGPVYPDSYRPEMLSDQITSPDTSLGFGGGDIAPMLVGSRFHVFDQ